MGGGNSIFSDKPELGWNPVIPESLGKISWNIACKKIKDKAY